MSSTKTKSIPRNEKKKKKSQGMHTEKLDPEWPPLKTYFNNIIEILRKKKSCEY